MGKSRRVMAALALVLTAAPAMADVKDGVDAWNRGDYHAAVEQWRPLAVAGNADAQFNLGQAYKLGRGVPVDLPMAMSWYRRAAEQGHPQAEDNYGLALFTDGRRAEATPWLEKSVARGEPRAELVLGTMLFNGDGVPRDYVRAYALIVRASAAGIADADRTLAEMDKYVPEDKRRQGQALAHELEAKQARPTLPPPALTASARPASSAPGRGPIRAIDPNDAGPPPPRVASAPPPPRPAPERHASATAAPPRGGDWRVQLGAFHDEGNAKRLWETMKAGNARLAPLQPYLVKAGAVTKLQAGPLPSAAAAQRVCASVRSGCLVITP